MRILFVENHPVSAKNVIAQFLTQHVVTVAPSLSAARRALEAGDFDLLLVEYDLDDGKSDEFVRELHASGEAPKVVGVSSHDEGNRALLQAGAQAICSKMRFDRIQSVIDSVTFSLRAPDSTANNLLWWVIPGALAGMPMPFIHPERRSNMGGPLTAYLDDLPILHAAGVRAVVSLLNLRSDAALYESAGFAFRCMPVPDGGPPTMEQAEEFVQFVGTNLTDHRPVAVHCEAGIGRTGTMLAAYLVSQGETVESAVTHVRSVEKAAIETGSQIRFLEQFAASCGRCNLRG